MSVSRESLEAKYGKVWNADELAQEFVVTAIIAPKIVARRRSDDVVGTLQFIGQFYFNWQPQEETDVSDKPERIDVSRAKFPLGQIAATPDSLEAIEESGQTFAFFLEKHVSGDWGIVDEEDRAANEAALVDGSRLLSAYRTLKARKIWIITEATDDQGHRAATTLLLPEEY